MEIPELFDVIDMYRILNGGKERKRKTNVFARAI